jgi:hypothetical protein
MIERRPSNQVVGGSNPSGRALINNLHLAFLGRWEHPAIYRPTLSPPARRAGHTPNSANTGSEPQRSAVNHIGFGPRRLFAALRQKGGSDRGVVRARTGAGYGIQGQIVDRPKAPGPYAAKD